jgi:hypothetical protein
VSVHRGERKKQKARSRRRLHEERKKQERCLFAAFTPIQVFRDGLVLAVDFTLVEAMPMTFVLYLHWLSP